MDRDEIKDRVNATLRQIQGEDGGEADPVKDKFGQGDNPRRYLPNPDNEYGLFFEEESVHYLGGRTVRCHTTQFAGKSRNLPAFGTACPPCRKFNTERARVNDTYPRDSDEGKAEYGKVARLWQPKRRYHTRVFNPTADDPIVMVSTTGPQIMGDLLVEYAQGEDSRGDFTSPKYGRTMIINRRGQMRETKYKVRVGKRQNIYAAWKEIKKDLPSFAPYYAEQMSVDEMKDLVKEAAAAPVQDERRERPSADDTRPKKPDCFGDADVHDPSADFCKDCRYFEKCKKTPDVAEGYEEGRYRKAEKSGKRSSKLSVLKDKLRSGGGGSRAREEDSSNEDA